MKYIELTQGKRAIVDDADYEWLNQWKWYYHSGYAARGVRNVRLPNGYQNIMMHRLINNTPDGYETDHINRNKLDNRRSNLRTASRAENRYNVLRQDNQSGVPGVCFTGGRWVATITVNRKQKHIGNYNELVDAINARRAAEIELFGVQLPTAS